ncbi:RNA-directed DNA polymerase, eukaryota, reverse transcriptase zinc-binding domain protein [Tanacetum coccineum]|uniref:RNA-directed DNA polymerase, eukaryota, reverse transcriptase zinc-binding domain protein n=1 Tax=Tanacetum coccineum TaxID=301880 RepID=A0ABQ4YYK0_9ASTR
MVLDHTAQVIRSLWKSLSIHKNVVKDRSWTILDDFNACLYPSERSSRGSKFTTAMHDFRDCVEEIEVEDISMTSLSFTWNKNPGMEGGLLKKLDRVLGNIYFMSSFSSSFAHFLPYMLSDYSPAVLVIPRIDNVKPRPFKFHNYLVTKDGFIPIVKSVWSNKVDGFFMFSLVSKLKMLKKPLRKLNFEQGNLFENVKCLKTKLASVQSSMNADPHNNSLREEELKTLKAYKAALKDEESFLRQKSKVEWLRAGDSNSKYFHNVVKGLFLKRFSDADAAYMVRSVLDEEVKLALFDIDGNKAPGPDVKDFFANGKLLKEVNVTIISLFLMLATPSKVSDYRPIACCNVVYKIISKVICNRIEGALNDIVDGNQSAFIPFRKISDNILLSQELMRNYHRNRGPAKCAFKIDIEKAYDSVE